MTMTSAMTTLIDMGQPVKPRLMEVVVPAEPRLMDVVTQPARPQLAEILATLRSLHLDRDIDLDDALYVKDGGYTYISFGRAVDERALAMALTGDQAYEVTVEVERRTTRGEGLLLSYDAHGERFDLSVRANRLVYEYSCAGAEYTLRSDREVPSGHATLRLVFTRTGPLQGMAALYINAAKVGEVAIPHLWPCIGAALDRGTTGAGRATLGTGEQWERSFGGTLKALMIAGVLRGAGVQTGSSPGRGDERQQRGAS
jgi:hypothetical protein